MNRFTAFAQCLIAFLLAGATVLAEDANKTKKFLTKPLIIEDQGSFFIGGVPKVTDYATVPGPNQPNTPNQITIGQMYVQFQIPARKAPNVPPVIMVHGSGHTGACLESTPDGREGWQPYFVRRGISTYVVDQAGRGRSGFDESVIHEAAALIRSGDTQKGLSKTPSFGRIPDNTWKPQDLALLVEKLRGAIVATHSQSGIMGHHMLRILKERGHLDMVKALITVEGSCSLPNSGLKPEDFDNIPYLALKGDYT